MSEAALWKHVRDAVGHRGHFARLEFNPEAGIPDVDFCVKSCEGKMELKHVNAAPKRVSTAVFGEKKGLRPSQIAWITTRVRHGGRVWILARVKFRMFLIAGSYAIQFNDMTFHALEKTAAWTADRPITGADWETFLLVIRRTT